MVPLLAEWEKLVLIYESQNESPIKHDIQQPFQMYARSDL